MPNPTGSPPRAFGRTSLAAAALCCLSILAPASALAGEIPPPDYLNYMPLEYPRLVRQTPASADLQLFGDPSARDYLDVDPRDGIDDARGRLFDALAIRFSPYMVRNTTTIPMDFKRFWDQSDSFPLNVTSWNVAASPPSVLREQTVDFNRLLDTPCVRPFGDDRRLDPASPEAHLDDCELLALLNEFDPFHPENPRFNRASVEIDFDPFTVMYFDFPGEDPVTWRDEFEHQVGGQLKRAYQGFGKTYVHPFVHETRRDESEAVRYELILQYWFFYPYNDGGNDHEGDWEHINVAISPRSLVERPMAAEEIRAILERDPSALDGRDPLVIKRIEYYFHHQVMELDFSRPNVYLPREQWKIQVENTSAEVIAEHWLWDQIRSRAYLDEEETVLNTHPVCFIGADNKGLDQLLAPPGGRNRDSHGTYPFHGMYKNIGPGGATEQVIAKLELRRHYVSGELHLPEDVETYLTPERIEILPDWERVHPLILDEPTVRREWSWMVLPIRWGYPATESPFAGVVAHAETGNLAPVGPTYQSSWNTSGSSSGFQQFQPHRFNSAFPLGFQDTFSNNLGFINGLTSTLLILPPIDLAWRVVAAPVRFAVDEPVSVFYPSKELPFRFVSFNLSYAEATIPEDFDALFLSSDLLLGVVENITQTDTSVVATGTINEGATSPMYGVSLYLGKKLVTTTSLRHSRSTLGLDVVGTSSQSAIDIRGELNFWEVLGDLRYNLLTGGLQPYFRLGYGWSWYRLENVTTQVAGEDPLPVDPSHGPWIRRPWSNPDGSSNAWANLWPSTIQGGAGVEWMLVRSIAPPPRGIDVGFLLDGRVLTHELGIQESLVPGATFDTGARDTRVTRWIFSVGATLSF